MSTIAPIPDTMKLYHCNQCYEDNQPRYAADGKLTCAACCSFDITPIGVSDCPGAAIRETGSAQHRKTTDRTSPWWKVGITDWLDSVLESYPKEAFPIAQFRHHGDAHLYAKHLQSRIGGDRVILIF
jgi:hypothetical protein